MRLASRSTQTFLLLLQVGGDEVVQEHDELGVHGDADVVGELRHHAALHLGLAARVWKTGARHNPCQRLTSTTRGQARVASAGAHLSAEARQDPARGWT